MSVWNPENVKDIAESLGIATLDDDATRALTSDIEFRLSQVLEEALKFMRHGKRSSLTTQDISQALKALDVEPLYGYESTRPLRFGEATIGQGPPLYYVEDEEMDFEKLINAPLPKVPREITFTAHWLAVEGVQPSIPQNPTSAEARSQELAPKGANANANLAAISGNDNVAVKPLVKHILSKELQQYFGKVCSALLDESNNDYRVAALASISNDPGLHQLVPYFVQFIAEKVTHNVKNIFVLTQMLELSHALFNNQGLFLDPYVASLVPPILTCMVGRKLGNSTDNMASYPLRQTAASLLKVVAKRYGKSSQMLKPRLARTCLKYFLDPTKPLASQYGGLIGLQAVGGVEIVRALVVPNLNEYESIMTDALESMDDGKKKEAEMIIQNITGALESIENDTAGSANGFANGHATEIKGQLEDKIGALFAERILERGHPKLFKAILEC